jgi:hypothetical protein
MQSELERNQPFASVVARDGKFDGLRSVPARAGLTSPLDHARPVRQKSRQSAHPAPKPNRPRLRQQDAILELVFRDGRRSIGVARGAPTPRWGSSALKSVSF